MVDLELLKKRGVTHEKWKTLFTAEKPSDKIKKLKELLADRNRRGFTEGCLKSRVWAAIDKAYDAPLDQVKWTFIQNLSQKKLGAEALTRELLDFGLPQMLKSYCPTCSTYTPVNSKSDCACSGKELVLDLPYFYDLVVGLIPAYVKIRWSKLFNDRDLIPHYSYGPLKLTTKRKLQCDIITDRIGLMANQFDYRSDRRQIILQTLLYSYCLQVVLEEWCKEEQTIIGENGEEETLIIKEGLRNCLPHPSKTFFDESFRLSTLNSDSGCAFFGYWHTTRWGGINRNKSYFNTEKVKYMSPDWVKNLRWYSQVYPCALKWPDSGSTGWSSNDREENVRYYGSTVNNDEDMTVVVANQFAKLVPSEWGLGDYDKPVWCRFVMASHDTVIYAAPVPYTPGSFYGYDFDGNRARNASMATEIYPFQTILSNYISQLYLSVEQNLTKLVFYDKNQVNEATIKRLQNHGARLLKGIQFIDYDSMESRWGQKEIRDAFSSPSFPAHNTAEIIQCISTTINILERVLQFSSQELGVAASHQQSATEQSIISQNMSNRLQFTSSFLDDGEHSDKRRLYEALLAYGDDEIFAQIGELNDVSRAALKEMGWTVEEEGDPGKTHAGIRGSKKALILEGFASHREAQNRLNNPAIAATMLQMSQYLLTNPMIVQAVGVPQIVDWFNAIFTWAGVPADKRIRVTKDASPEQQATEAQAQMAAVANQVVAQAVEGMAKALGENVIAPMQQAITVLAKRQQQSDAKDGVQDQAIAEVVHTIQQMIFSPPPPPEPTPIVVPMPDQTGGIPMPAAT